MDEEDISELGKQEIQRYNSRDINEASGRSVGQVLESGAWQTLKQRAEQEYLDQIGKHLSDGDRILDFCGGYANASRKLRNTHTDIDIDSVVIDISEEELRQGRDMQYGDELSFIVGDGHRLPVADDSFDAVLARSAFHHLPDWHRSGLDEIWRVLKPDGVLAFKDPLRYNPLAWIFRQVFESRDKTEAEVPLNPVFLRDRLERVFGDVNLTWHYLISPPIAMLDKHLPVDMTTVAISVQKAESWLFRHGGFVVAGGVVGVAQNPRTR